MVKELGFILQEDYLSVYTVYLFKNKQYKHCQTQLEHSTPFSAGGYARYSWTYQQGPHPTYKTFNNLLNQTKSAV